MTAPSRTDSAPPARPNGSGGTSTSADRAAQLGGSDVIDLRRSLGGASGPAAFGPAAFGEDTDAPRRRTRERFANTTPSRLRLVSLIVAAVIALCTAVAWSSLSERHDASVRLRDDASVLAARARGISSALIDADAAATAAFLTSGGEDPAERRRYEEAITRAIALTTRAAALTTGDETRITERLAVSIGDYNAMISRARGDRVDHDETGYTQLAAASAYRTGTLVPLVAELETTAAAKVTEAAGTTTGRSGVVIAALLIAIAAAAALGVELARASHRIINVPVALSAVCMVVAVVTVGAASVHQSALLDDDAAEAVDATDLISDLRATAVRLQTERNAQALTGLTPDLNTDVTQALADRDITVADVEAAREGRADFGGELATMVERAANPSERALAAETLVRWQRYVDIVAAIPTAAVTSDSQAATLNANRAFVGFNVTIDALLDDVQFRYRAALDAVATTSGRLPTLVAVLGVFAALLAIAGVQIRIDDYR